jgi:succinate dehydrogenase/fumarate reductase-like Fe-S protein
MSEKLAKVKVFRFDPSLDKEPYYQIYEVPLTKGMSAMGTLDYIYQNLDSTLAYYDHAGCSLGICGRCTGRTNGKPGLFCQTLIQGDITLEPVSASKVVKDLVIQRVEKDTQTPNLNQKRNRKND